MTNRPADTPDHPMVQADGIREAEQAERHALDLSDLIGSRYLAPDGEAIAMGARGLIYAILALRQASIGATAGTASAIAELDTTLGIITDAIVGAVAETQTEGAAASGHPSRPACSL